MFMSIAGFQKLVTRYLDIYKSFNEELGWYAVIVQITSL